MAAVFAFAVASFAQTKVYAEIIGDEYDVAGKVSVKVEFGKNSQNTPTCSKVMTAKSCTSTKWLML